MPSPDGLALHHGGGNSTVSIRNPNQEFAMKGFILCFKLETDFKRRNPNKNKTPIPLLSSFSPSPSALQPPPLCSQVCEEWLVSCVYKAPMQCNCSFRTLLMTFTIPIISKPCCSSNTRPQRSHYPGITTKRNSNWLPAGAIHCE